jgi:spore coat protein A
MNLIHYRGFNHRLVVSFAGSIVFGCSSDAPVSQQPIGSVEQPSVLVQQTPLLGASIPKYVDAVPTFSGNRVSGAGTVAVDMQEFQQKVLPASIYATLAAPYRVGTYLWGYKVGNKNPSWPASTIEARRNRETTAVYTNNLRKPDGSPPVLQKYLTVDQTIHWADPLGTTKANDCMMGPPLAAPCQLPYQGPVPTTVHLHGAEVWSGYDGGPDTWFTPGFAQTGAAFVSNTYHYVNTQESATLWFHDHALGTTRLNVFSGLSGFYLLRDTRDTGRVDNPIGLPAGSYEQELMIADRQFDTNGQLFFPDNAATNADYHPFWAPEFFGDVMTVNGKSWPYLRVEPRRYRFRLLNGSNARFLEMGLVDQAGTAGPSVWQIGSDGGFLDTPAKLDAPTAAGGSGLLLGPAERADVIIDFAGMQGKTFTLTNSANGPYPGGDPVDPATTGQVMQFRVNLPLTGNDTSYNPAAPQRPLRAAPIVKLDPAVTHKPADKRRQLVLVEVEGAGGPIEVLLNNSEWSGMRQGSPSEEPIAGCTMNSSGTCSTEVPQVGSTEVWEIINLTEDAHPIHIHLVQFQLINRQDLSSADTYLLDWSARFPGGTYGGVTYPQGVFIPGYGPPLAYNTPNSAGALGGNIDPTPYLIGAARTPSAGETGWKDTVKVWPGTVTRVAIRWAPQATAVSGVKAGDNLYSFDPSTGPGYVWHCHILDHEDNEMMRPFLIGK